MPHAVQALQKNYSQANVLELLPKHNAKPVFSLDSLRCSKLFIKMKMPACLMVSAQASLPLIVCPKKALSTAVYAEDSLFDPHHCSAWSPDSHMWLMLVFEPGQSWP